ncbi:hypothetical protein FH972_021626 [Carpinus fangiana]|uniref:Alpha/beta hydrolase fold-3 domain-containing protein n=1 Tax=Carpinus fangiana TaxID=176857 RepID=A0A5N6KQ80_9ROSI|nr:hypothetical protein FH972_021626 [Carpinus fangiana]
MEVQRKSAHGGCGVRVYPAPPDGPTCAPPEHSRPDYRVVMVVQHASASPCRTQNIRLPKPSRLSQRLTFQAATPFTDAPWHNPPAMRAARLPVTDATFAKLANKGTTRIITLSDGSESELRIHTPLAPTGKPSPLIVLAFGGGFVAGENRQLSPYAGALAHLYGATVVNLDYRLAPEHAFPTAQNDAWDSLQWVAEHAAELGADPAAGFILGGVSAGGSLAATCAQRWADEGKSPKLTGAWLSVPMIFDISNVPAEYKDVYLAREQNAQAPVINDVAIGWVEKHLKPDFGSRQYSPFNSPNKETIHVGMPPSYFQIAGMDPLRDDGLIYERVLRKAGVPTKLEVYPGVPHAHFSMVPTLKSSLRSNLDTVKGFAWLLKTQEPTDQEAGAALTAVPSSG